MHEFNCFITLTYNDENLPFRSSLDYSHFQKFMRRLRKDCGSKVRFYMCGEYGEQKMRPHFHAILFGLDFADRKYHATTKSGFKLYTSPTLSRLWPFGFSTIGSVTLESAGYCARYCVQKVTGFNADDHYRRVDSFGEYQLVPEFNKMSLKPGIGSTWFEKFKSDVYPRDYVVAKGVKYGVPAYYDKLLDRGNPDMLEELKAAREQRARERYFDNTDERLETKEIVHKAKAFLLERNLK